MKKALKKNESLALPNIITDELNAWRHMEVRMLFLPPNKEDLLQAYKRENPSGNISLPNFANSPCRIYYGEKRISFSNNLSNGYPFCTDYYARALYEILRVIEQKLGGHQVVISASISVGGRLVGLLKEKKLEFITAEQIENQVAQQIANEAERSKDNIRQLQATN